MCTYPSNTTVHIIHIRVLTTLCICVRVIQILVQFLGIKGTVSRELLYIKRKLFSRANVADKIFFKFDERDTLQSTKEDPAYEWL